MELNDIKIFIELYKNRSISKTAEKLNYTQSNVSTRLMKLEKEFNTTLFLRTRYGLEMLPSTEQFYTYAKAIEESVNRLYDGFSVSKQQINIGSTQLLSKLYFPTLYGQKELFNLHTTTVNKLSRHFVNQIFDVIITHTKLDSIKNIIKYHKTENLLWTSSVPLKNNVSKAINIIINRDKHCPLRALTIDTIHSLQLNVSFVEVDTLDLMLSLIYTSNCIALLPQKLVEEDTRLKELEQLPPLSLDTYLYFHPEMDNDVLTDCFTNSLAFNQIL